VEGATEGEGGGSEGFGEVIEVLEAVFEAAEEVEVNLTA
jgi:hypothetical protein